MEKSSGTEVRRWLSSEDFEPMPPSGACWRRLDSEASPLVSMNSAAALGRDFLEIRPEALRRLAREAMRDVNFLLRTSRLSDIAGILSDSTASEGDRFLAQMALENAAIASAFQLPLCQDTGTACAFGWMGSRVLVAAEGGGEADEAALISEGIAGTYGRENLRMSIQCASGTFAEKNSGTNLPAAVSLRRVRGTGCRFLFTAKGGGSANKTRLFPESPALLSPERLLPFLTQKIRELGTAACPPYRIAVTIGGLTPEDALEKAKLLSCGAFDHLPDAPLPKDTPPGMPFRDRKLETELLLATRHFGIGAQLPGRFFALDVRVLRLPRHSASLFIGLAVSCLADRQIWGRIDESGVWLEDLERHPERFLPEPMRSGAGKSGSEDKVSGKPVEVNLDRPLDEVRRDLARCPAGTLLSLSGTLLVARDLAHARIRSLMETGGEVPPEFFRRPIYYAGPAKAPEGFPCGSFGPTTAGRMDADLAFFQERGACLITLAKGNRSAAVRESCRRFGGFYLGTFGGVAALIARRCIRSSRVVAFEDLGMEAVREIVVSGLPAFVIIDDRGNDLYER